MGWVGYGLVALTSGWVWSARASATLAPQLKLVCRGGWGPCRPSAPHHT